MFAKVGKVTGIRKALGYNELKVSRGQADMLSAENFLKPGHLLSKEDKFDRFLQRNSLREDASSTTLRVSISFDVREQVSDERMKEAARRYMKVIGFDKQPYLVYRHYDAGHPHCHIIATKVTKEGNLLDLNPATLRRSHALSREIELEFGLVRHMKPEDATLFSVRQARRVEHGQGSLKHSISDVLNTVFDHYKYTSLEEYNAILGLYRVRADRGRENSRLYKGRGLIYHAVDENGKRAGSYLKASGFFLQPTLARLEEKFALNASLAQKNQQRIKTEINWALAGTVPDWKGFEDALGKQGIDVVVQVGRVGDGREVFFVDHTEKAVFRGASLGSDYRLEAIQLRCAAERRQEEEELEHVQRLRLGL